MKKRYVFLIILALIVVAVGIFAYVNRGIISAVVHGLTVTEEQRLQQKQETDKKTEEAVKQLGVEEIRPLTEAEAEKLSKGELTEEEAIDIIIGKNNETTDTPVKDNTPSGQKKPSETKKPEKTDNSQKIAEANNRIAKLVGKMYVLKSQFTGELKSVEKWVKAEYKKLTAEEKKSISVKTKIGNEAVSKATALEKSCDAQVESILSEISTLLKGSGQSTDLVKQIRKAYEEEKQLTKSYYVSKYK